MPQEENTNEGKVLKEIKRVQLVWGGGLKYYDRLKRITNY